MKMLYRIEITPKKFWFVLIPLVFIVGFVAFLCAFLLVDKVVMPKITGVNNRGEVTVPDLIGLSSDSAKAVCFASGVRLTETRAEYNDTVSANGVISQDPLPGSLAKQGRHVMVVVSKGTEIGTVPAVVGLWEGPAKKVLRNAGFANIGVTSEYNEIVKKECGIGTNPEEGSITSREARITLVLSRGERPVSADVPELVGVKLSDAKTSLEAAGLNLGTLSYEAGTEIAPGFVVSQSVEPGSSAPLESSVNLVISIE